VKRFATLSLNSSMKQLLKEEEKLDSDIEPDPGQQHV
jgi:hypothetical protein